ncbi:MAG: ABC transporter ATP-binding protein [Dehalococcoidia bacterium]|nr:ABC transporter ATP-binding protein [Dehalococcoidia bacterium]
MAVLECKGLTKNYGRTCALNGLDITIEQGRIVGLLGPNGSGKSTFIKLCNGLLTPTLGTITINGFKPGIESKKLVSYLPDVTYLADWMRVSDILDFFTDFYVDFDCKKALEMLASLRIEKHQTLRSLSKGNKEKVQLILVMARSALLYLLDEPIGGVDPAARDYILSTIIKNRNHNASIIISTHLISDIEQVLDDVIILKEGKVILSEDINVLREKTGTSVDAYFREVFRC